MRHTARHASLHEQALTRRRFLGGAAVVLAAGAGMAALEYGLASGGVDVSGSFYSRHRRTTVGYTIGYPAGHGPGSVLPLIVMLHGYGGDHTSVPSGMSPAHAVSLLVNGKTLTPMAMVTVDGGGGYWHPHPDDDPMGMVVHELIPMLQDRGLGVPPHKIAAMGISMGGYGAIALAEHYPELFRAVAAISPAIFTTYAWVHYVNPGAYWSASDFARYDAITHVGALRGIPMRIASGQSDPFHAWVEELVAALPPGAVVRFPPGGHTGSFFLSQEPPSLAFLSRHLRP
jgi:S-formylglutathione hydrolase FrmB